MKKSIIFIILLFTISYAQSQSLNMRNHYSRHLFLINPAFAGDSDHGRGFFNGRYQWIGMDDAPRYISLVAHSPLAEGKMGIGGTLSNEQESTISRLAMNIAYSYKAEINEDNSIRFGIFTGFTKGAFHRGQVEMANQNDPVLNSNYFDTFFFSLGAGIRYRWKDLTVSVSSPELLHQNSFSPRVAAYAGYRINVQDEQWAIQPSVLFQTIPYSPSQVDANLMLEWNKTLWTQVTYRTGSSMVFSLGVQVWGVGVGYAYEVNQNALSNVTSGTHEIVIAFL